MGLEDVKNEIVKEAKKEKKQLIEEAEEKKQEMIKEAEEKAEEIEKETDEEIQEEKESIRKKTESNANMESKKIRLEAKQDEIQKTFDRFAESLRDMNKEEKKKYVENAIDTADFEVGKVMGNEEFSEAVSSHNFEEIQEYGVILESENGERRLNLTFEKIRQDFEQNYRKDVAEMLLDQ